jgi:hypothetical protein
MPTPMLEFVDFVWFENLVGEVPTPVPSLIFLLSFNFSFFPLKFLNKNTELVPKIILSLWNIYLIFSTGLPFTRVYYEAWSFNA